MRYFLTILFATILSTACSTAPATNSNSAGASPTKKPAVEPQKASIEPIKQFLLTSAASDFHDHGPAGPLQFRGLRIGHIAGADGKESYRLCGEFLQQGKTEWMPFTTIKTSGYEQYIGGAVANYCPASIVWDTDGDLSSTLQNQLASLPTANKSGIK